MYLNNLVNGCGFGGRNFEETSKKFLKTGFMFFPQRVFNFLSNYFFFVKENKIYTPSICGTKIGHEMFQKWDTKCYNINYIINY